METQKEKKQQPAIQQKNAAHGLRDLFAGLQDIYYAEKQ
jgi:hypothetical protein